MVRKQADKHYIALEHACLQIGKNPDLGRKYVEISEQLFGFRMAKHIIFYQVINKDRIEIVRILHERMDLKNRNNK